MEDLSGSLSFNWDHWQTVRHRVLDLFTLHWLVLFLPATKSSLDALRRRLHVPKHQPSSSTSSSQSAPPPLFRASIQLAIPNIVLRPSLDDIQVSILFYCYNKLYQTLSAVMYHPVYHLNTCFCYSVLHTAVIYDGMSNSETEDTPQEHFQFCISVLIGSCSLLL